MENTEEKLLKELLELRLAKINSEFEQLIECQNTTEAKLLSLLNEYNPTELIYFETKVNDIIGIINSEIEHTNYNFLNPILKQFERTAAEIKNHEMKESKITSIMETIENDLK